MSALLGSGILLLVCECLGAAACDAEGTFRIREAACGLGWLIVALSLTLFA